ncbi:MAG: autotransporter-associated beta strand repeat-containing protein, partial [Novosphingobium sp.]
GDLGILSGGIRLTNVNAGGSGNTIRAMNPGTFGLELDIAADGTLSNTIGSGIALTKTGTGTVTLTGTNTYGGGTTINAGAIRVDDFARLGTGSVTAAAGGSLILDYNGAGQLLQSTPFMTGAGSFIKEGSGDVVMNQTSTYTGGTTIRAGRIGLNNGDALGTGNIQVDSGATLGIGGVTLANSVSGSGSIVKTANNQATLSGNNSAFTGLFDIQDGSVVLNDGRSAGSGIVAIAAGSFIDVDSTVGDTTMAASLSGAGDLGIISANRVRLTGSNTLSGVVFVDAGTLQIEGSQNIGTANITLSGAGGVLDLSTAQSTTLANTVSGVGRVVKTGSGTVFVTGANTYSGGTDIQQGAIRVTDVSVLGTGAVSVQAGAALDLAIANAQTLNQSISGAGILRKSAQGDLTLLGNSLTGGLDIVGGRVIVNSAAALGSGPVSTAVDTQLVFDNSATETLSTPVSGAGALTKNGSGALIIQNANTYTGGTVINAGRLGLNNGQGLGTGSVIVMQGAQLSLGGVTVANAITGAGQVVKTANNTGSLTGNNAYSGGTDIQQGTLVVNSPAALGTGGVSVASGALLNVTYNGASNIAMGNSVTGAGGLVKDGSGTLVINTSANTFSGGTTINAGRIGLNFGNGLGTGGVVIASGAELAIGSVAFNNSVSGAGRIVKTSAGAATLGGTNTHSGGLDIQGGSVAVNGSAPLGTGGVTIASGASLIYTNSAAASFANGLSGAGTFEKLGAGQLSFANNFTIGALTLSAGRTRINTVGTTNATVAAGATLDGTGRIIGNVTNNGTVAPGNSIGTLTVQGNYVHGANAVLEIEFDAGGNIDLLDVTGNATLNGGTIRFVSVGGAEGQGGTFLRTGGTLTGTFATVETVGALLPLSVVYEPNRAFMAPSVLTARPSTFNAQSLAAADTALGFVDAIGAADVRHAQGNRLWINGIAAWGQRSASGTTLAYDHDTRGISGGATFAVGDAITVGLAMGWAKGDITLGSNGGGGDQSSLLGSLHARYAGTGFTLGGGLLYGKVDQNTLRNVSFNGFSGSVTGETESSLFGGFAELGLPLGSTGGWAFSANLRGSYVRQKQDGYTESGSSPLRLKLGDLTTSTVEGQIGFTAKTSLWNRANGGEETSEGIDLRIELGGRYLGNVGDRKIPVTFAVSNAGIVLQGDTRDTVQGRFGLGLDYTIGSGATFSLGYRGEVGKTDRHAVMAGASVRF